MKGLTVRMTRQIVQTSEELARSSCFARSLPYPFLEHLKNCRHEEVSRTFLYPSYLLKTDQVAKLVA